MDLSTVITYNDLSMDTTWMYKMEIVLFRLILLLCEANETISTIEAGLEANVINQENQHGSSKVKTVSALMMSR